MDKWDQRFLRLAAHVSQWSKDPSTKVGAVIIDRMNRVVSLGYNGFPRGVPDNTKQLSDRDEKYPRTIHAEVNAILFANTALEGMTLYVWPLSPCAPCAALIIQTGITRVVTKVAMPEPHHRWEKSFECARQMFQDAQVVFNAFGSSDKQLEDGPMATDFLEEEWDHPLGKARIIPISDLTPQLKVSGTWPPSKCPGCGVPTIVGIRGNHCPNGCGTFLKHVKKVGEKK